MLIKNVSKFFATRDQARQFAKENNSKVTDNGKEAGEKRWEVIFDKLVKVSSKRKFTLNERKIATEFASNSNGELATVFQKKTKQAFYASVKRLNNSFQNGAHA